jgi:hypothetical protein
MGRICADIARRDVNCNADDADFRGSFKNALRAFLKRRKFIIRVIRVVRGVRVAINSTTGKNPPFPRNPRCNCHHDGQKSAQIRPFRVIRVAIRFTTNFPFANSRFFVLLRKILAT